MWASMSSGAWPAARPRLQATCATSTAIWAETSRICGIQAALLEIRIAHELREREFLTVKFEHGELLAVSSER